jgi:hypothetical protein
MRRIGLAILFVSVFTAAARAVSVDFEVNDYALFYNGENADYWEETRATLTYLENLLDFGFNIRTSTAAEFYAGIGLLFPITGEEKLLDYYPLVRMRLNFGTWAFSIGALESDHDMPSPILDPIIELTPQVRLLSLSQLPLNTNETYPDGAFSHGYYEYGAKLEWFLDNGRGEIYLNWQLPDTTNHRERFDTGVSQRYSLGSVPLYFCFHYWHNGGHENEHPVTITENYTLAAGLRNDNFSFLYLASYLLPDREAPPEQNVFGEGLYGSWTPVLRDWRFVLELFVSDAFIAGNHQFVSVEGDPFFRVPLYFGANVFRDFVIDDHFKVEIGFVNGTFLPYTDAVYGWKNIRYDQKVRVDFNYAFDILGGNHHETN